VQALVEIAETLDAPVLEFPRTHPLSGGVACV
jgi:hypothetical protein